MNVVRPSLRWFHQIHLPILPCLKNQSESCGKTSLLTVGDLHNA
jgi:hypothetical protein